MSRFQFSFEPTRELTLDDFRHMLSMLKPVNNIMGRMMGLRKADPETTMRRLLGIIDAMTPQERRIPSWLINASRCRRIAVGAGVNPDEVAEFVKQFNGMAKLRKRMLRFRRRSE